MWVTSAAYSAGNVVRLYDLQFKYARSVTVLAVLDPTPHGHYAPPQNVSKTMPTKSPLLPEPHAWYQLLNVSGAKPPAGLGYDFVAFNQDRSSSPFLLKNNTIQNHRARGMLIKASNGTIEGNRIENSSLGGIIITPELYWGEGASTTSSTHACIFACRTKKPGAFCLTLTCRTYLPPSNTNARTRTRTRVHPTTHELC